MGLTNKLGQLSQSIQQDSSNNIGIGGAVDASYKLKVTGTTLTTGAATFSSSVTANGVINANDNLRIYAANQFWFNSGFRGQIVPYSAYGGGTDYSPFFTSETSLAFGVGGNATKALMITSTGNVGIGTSSPSSYAGGNLAIVGSTSGNMGISIDNTYTSTAAGTASLFLYNGGTIKCRFDYARDLDAGILGTIANIPMLFFANGSERMRITSGGDVGIGPSGTATSISRLVVAGKSNTGSDYSFIATDNSGGTSLGVRNDKIIITPGVYSYNYASTANVFVQSDGVLGRNSSSIKYKKNIENYTKGLDYVLKLRPVLYESKNPAEDNLKFTGFIAEEVDKIGLIELVHYDNNEPDSLHYPHFVALLTKAIQEQNQLITELSAKVTALENKS